MRIQKYTGLACPDNPARTADYGHFPWEHEPEEIIDDQATMNVFETIEQDDTEYGKDANELREWLIDAILNDDAATDEMLRRCRDLSVVQRMCGEIANDRSG